MQEILTTIELKKIFSWLPYRDDWPVDRNKVDGSIDRYFGGLIKSFRSNRNFSCYQTQHGGMSNYLGFLCYKQNLPVFEDQGLLVYVSLCAPVATYGVVKISVSESSVGWGWLDSARVTKVDGMPLQLIEIEILRILTRNNIGLITPNLASRKLPDEVALKLDVPCGGTFLDGIFQEAD